MKRLSLPIPTSRRQHGFVRATALFISAGLVSAGVVTTQQVKAHQAAHAKHVLAIKKLAVKDCGCGILVSKHHSARLYQTAADADGNNYEQAVSLKAGQRLALGVSDPAGSIQPGGAWVSDFGTVDASGVYTAPSFTPPEGVDRLHYTDSASNDVWVTVRILPNPDIPNSDQTPYVTFDYLHNNAMQGGPTPQAQQAQRADAADESDDVTFAPTSQTVVELPGDTPAPPLQIIATASLAAQTVDGTSVLTLPATRSGGDDTSAIYAQPLDEAPKFAELIPDISPPTGPCTSGETSVYTPYTTTVTPHKGLDTFVSIKADSGVKAKVHDIFDIDLTLGLTYPVKGQVYDWKRSRFQYVYVCVNNHWVQTHKYICDGYTLSLVTFPPWAIIFESFPRDNKPLLPYSPDACHP